MRLELLAARKTTQGALLRACSMAATWYLQLASWQARESASSRRKRKFMRSQRWRAVSRFFWKPPGVLHSSSTVVFQTPVRFMCATEEVVVISRISRRRG